MGLAGGLLGIGGSVVMIPAMFFVFGENQHLYQASAMICNFFVAVSATAAHRKGTLLMKNVVKLLIPSALAGVVGGVLLSNAAIFAGKGSYILVRIFGIFLLYVAFYNILKLFGKVDVEDDFDISNVRQSTTATILTGLVTGFGAGLLGLGGGSICVPMQQIFLKIPLKRAISNSAATIIFIALVGALLKNATLSEHSIALTDSLKIAACIVPTAVVGGFLGGSLIHFLTDDLGGLHESVRALLEGIGGGIVILEELLELIEFLLDGGLVVVGEYLAVLGELLADGVDGVVRRVANFYRFLALSIFSGVSLRVLDHLIDGVAVEGCAACDRDLLGLAGTEILGGHGHDAVGIDVERDLDLRDAPRRRRDRLQLEAAETHVVGRHGSLTLHHVDFDLRLVVCSRCEDL